MLHLKKIEHQFINCPSCQKPILELIDNKMKVCQSRYWLHDGDTIGGLWHKLIAANKIQVNEKNQLISENLSFDYELLVGSQPCCGEDYYCIMLSIVDEKVDSDFEQTYFHENKPQGPEHYWSVENTNRHDNVEENWFACSYDNATPKMLKHYIGPFSLTDSEEVKTQYGVSCHSEVKTWKTAADTVLFLWDDILELQKKFHTK